MRAKYAVLALALSFDTFAAAPAQAEEANMADIAAPVAVDLASSKQLGAEVVNSPASSVAMVEISQAPATRGLGIERDLQFDLAQTTSFDASQRPTNNPVHDFVSASERLSASESEARLQALNGPAEHAPIEFEVDNNAVFLAGEGVPVRAEDRIPQGDIEQNVILNRPREYRPSAKLSFSL